MFCPQCGNEANSEFPTCASCGAGTDWSASAPARNRLVRPRGTRMVAGVCSGVAIRYGWDIHLVRMTFAVLVCVTTGAAILLYLAAWAIVPQALYAVPAQVRRVDRGRGSAG